MAGLPGEGGPAFFIAYYRQSSWQGQPHGEVNQANGGKFCKDAFMLYADKSGCDDASSVFPCWIPRRYPCVNSPKQYTCYNSHRNPH